TSSRSGCCCASTGAARRRSRDGPPRPRMPQLASTVLRGANRLRPLLKTATQVGRATAAGGALAVLPGERLSTERLQTLLGVGARDLAPHLGLVVHAAVPDAIHEGAAKALAARK